VTELEDEKNALRRSLETHKSALHVSRIPAFEAQVQQRNTTIQELQQRLQYLDEQMTETLGRNVDLERRVQDLEEKKERADLVQKLTAAVIRDLETSLREAHTDVQRVETQRDDMERVCRDKSALVRQIQAFHQEQVDHKVNELLQRLEKAQEHLRTVQDKMCDRARASTREQEVADGGKEETGTDKPDEYLPRSTTSTDSPGGNVEGDVAWQLVD
jgi:DNA repair exonuclease SbcCD ATPase subunit